MQLAQFCECSDVLQCTYDEHDDSLNLASMSKKWEGGVMWRVPVSKRDTVKANLSIAALSFISIATRREIREDGRVK